MRVINQSAQRRLLDIRGRARAASRKQVSEKVRSYLAGESCVAADVPSSNDLPAHTERRRSSRKAIVAGALVRRVGGFNFEVALKDISTGGCKVEMLEPCELGDLAITRLPQLEPLGSRICWTEGTITGMEFSTSIHPAVFDMLLKRLNPVQA